MFHRHTSIIVLITASALLSACGGSKVQKGGSDYGPSKPVDVSGVKEPVPKVEPKSKYGNPKSYVVFGKRYHVLNSSHGYSETGLASWYGKKFHGRRTSSGETYDMYQMTAAHKSLPLPTYVRVENLENGKDIIVRVNDRGPFHEGRIIDLSYTAASKLDVIRKGTARVRVTAIDPANPAPHTVADARPATEATVYKSSAEGIYVQVGAFSVKQNAINMQNKLSGMSSHLVTIHPVKQEGAILYKVKVGPIFHIDLVDQVVASLGKMGIEGYQIISN